MPEINNLLKNKLILANYIDAKNRLWCSVAQLGVELIDLKTEKLLKRYTEKDGMPGQNIKAIFEDSKGKMWIGGWQEGITILSNDVIPTFKNKLTTANGLTDNMIRSIFEDSDENIWVGTRHHGVMLFRNNKIYTVSLIDGLLSNTIWSINAGPNDEIWLGTDVGVERIDRHKLNVLPTNRNFLNGECTAIFNFKNNFWGCLTTDGFIIYKPEKSKRNIPAPTIEITKTTVNGSQYLLGKNNELSYNQNNITIEFTGLSFKDEKSTRYQFRLLGADTNWTTPHYQRAVSFASISPGNYTFQVRAITFDGIISKIPASLSFVIDHPFWLQWWFITISLLILSILLFLGYRYRIKQLVKLEHLRQRIASDLHDDVGTNLSSILLTSRLMEKQFDKNGEGKEYLQQLSLIASKTQENLKETVWLLNPINDSSADLILRLKSIASQILLNINFNFITEENVLPEKLSLEVKRNIVLIFKEILQNVIKHSDAQLVVIELKKNKELFIMKVMDDGKGFNISEATKGNGLTNLKSRAKSLSGDLDIISELGNGTQVILSLNTTQMRTIKN